MNLIDAHKLAIRARVYAEICRENAAKGGKSRSARKIAAAKLNAAKAREKRKHKK